MKSNKDYVLNCFIKAAYNLKQLFGFRSKKAVSYYLTWTYTAGSLIASSADNLNELRHTIETLMRANYNLAGTGNEMVISDIERVLWLFENSVFQSNEIHDKVWQEVKDDSRFRFNR